MTIFSTLIGESTDDKEYWSNELNFSSTVDGPLQWLGGLYQYREAYTRSPNRIFQPDQVELRTVYARPVTATALPTGLVGSNPDGDYLNLLAHVDVRSYAAFGQLDWRFANRWQATIGARYSYDEKEGWETRRITIWDPTTRGASTRAYDNSPPLTCSVAKGDVDAAGVTVSRDVTTGAPTDAFPTQGFGPGTGVLCRARTVAAHEWEGWSGKAVIQWTPQDNLNSYLAYNRGYKAGAIRLGSFEADVSSEPEFLNAYEIGVKVDLFDKRLRLNTAAYYYDYQDYQIPLTRINDADTTRLITDFYNIPKVESYGFELESSWLVTDALKLMVTYGLIESEIKSDIEIPDPLDQTGSVAISEGGSCSRTSTRHVLSECQRQRAAELARAEGVRSCDVHFRHCVREHRRIG